MISCYLLDKYLSWIRKTPNEILNVENYVTRWKLKFLFRAYKFIFGIQNYINNNFVDLSLTNLALLLPQGTYERKCSHWSGQACVTEGWTCSQLENVNKGQACPLICVDIRPLWGLFGAYKETNVRLLFLGGPLRGTNLCVNAKSIPGTPRIIYIPLLE